MVIYTSFAVFETQICPDKDGSCFVVSDLRVGLKPKPNRRVLKGTVVLMVRTGKFLYPRNISKLLRTQK